ncbi:MAG TPA: ADOP family duplicated permease [Gemmatimonadales bacterium]|nr:ADOP family duplicated permease [Gemmatimonadales bacterium]
MLTGFFDDARLALRSLWRSPGFALTAGLTLALGVGATTTLVSALDTMLFRPPVAVKSPEGIVRPYYHSGNAQFGDWTNSSGSFPDILSLRRVTGFAQVAAFYTSRASMGRGSEARPVSLTAVTGNYFELLGTSAAMGRMILPEDDTERSGTLALVLSERLWRTRFASDPAVIGRTIPIDKSVYTVVGVAPRGFDGGNFETTDGWVALTPVGMQSVGPSFRTQQGWYWVQPVARLAPGVTPVQAAAEATAAIRAGRDSTAQNGFKDIVFGPVQEARGPDFKEDARLVYWLAGVSLIVLLIACANVANLQLVRGLARSRELAIRKALGGGRGRIAMQLFLEGWWLALLAGGAGILVCQWGGDLLRRFVLPAGMSETFAVDARVLGIAALAAAAAALLSSLLPAFRVVQGDLTPVLKDGARGTGFRSSRLRPALVVLQVALSILLVVGAGLFVQSLRNLRAIRIGYDRDHIVMITADPASAGFDGVATGAAFETMAEAARRYPGVEAVTLTNGEPFGWSMSRGLKILGMDSLPRMSSGGPYVQAVTADYFRTMGMRIQQGRFFSDADRRGEPAVALIGSTMARRFFGEGKALGRCLLLNGSTNCTEVIGVVSDGIRYSPQEEPQALYYVPLPPPDSTTSHLTLFVRTRGNAADLAGGLRATLQTAVPNLPYVYARSLEEVLAPRYQSSRLGATLFGLFATVALVLASLGIYSVLAYTVRGRTRELGIRLALGALPQSLLALVVRDGLRLAATGVAFGVAAALLAGRALGSLIYGVSAHDVPTMLVAGGTVLLVAVAASLLPARRAARVDPMQSLRSE